MYIDLTMDPSSATATVHNTRKIILLLLNFAKSKRFYEYSIIFYDNIANYSTILIFYCNCKCLFYLLLSRVTNFSVFLTLSNFPASASLPPNIYLNLS